MSKIYVASSWRNVFQPSIVSHLRDAGHEVYDFRHPTNNDNGFGWSEIDPNWRNWTPTEFRNALDSVPAVRGFDFDSQALDWCDTCILVLPCGRSAHLELGYACGAQKRTAVYMPVPEEPELMYKMLDRVLVSVYELLAFANNTF